MSAALEKLGTCYARDLLDKVEYAQALANVAKGYFVFGHN